MAYTSLQRLFVALAAVLFASFSYAQCPNTLAVYNFKVRTACTNGTLFIVPVDKTAVQNAVKPYKLLALPNDASLFPNGFPAGKHPVVVSSGTNNDIRMNSLQLMQNLLQGSIRVPYVDRLNDGKTPFQFSVKQYIGGMNGQDVSGLVPAIVASLGGTTVYVASFVPNNAPYLLINSAPAEYIAQIKKIIVPNPVSGPGVINEAVDTDFFTSTNPGFPAKTFHTLSNLPLILTNTKCQRNPIYFNETFTNPIFRNSKVTLYSPGGAFAGVYNNVAGYSASGSQIGYDAEDCAAAAAKTDPKALA